jgi:hypothetical protein
MNDHPVDFDFTAEELFAAFRLVLPDEEARRDADALHEALAPGMDWSTSHELLLLLSIATATGRARVDRIREAWQATMPAEAVKAENRRWQTKREEMRRSLRESGKHIPHEES